MQAFKARPERALAHSPGHRPGGVDVMGHALKGQKRLLVLLISNAFALSGRIISAKHPRAMPWAKSLLGFQPAHRPLVNLNKSIVAHRPLVNHM